MTASEGGSEEEGVEWLWKGCFVGYTTSELSEWDVEDGEGCANDVHLLFWKDGIGGLKAFIRKKTIGLLKVT